jgi:hypothetical protein
MKNNKKVLFLTCLVSLCVCSISFGNVLKGRLEKFGTYGILPGSYISVTLSKENGESLMTTVTDPDGKYIFDGVKPGVYVLRIWVKGFDLDPLSHSIKVLEDVDVTDADTILIHKFTFELPKEQACSEALMKFLSEKIRFVAQGSHYALPENVNIWPVLKCLNGNYLISTEKPVRINKNGKWTSREIIVDRPVEEILAVLVTEKGDNDFRWRISSDDREFQHLPENSYILAKRKIISY